MSSSSAVELSSLSSEDTNVSESGGTESSEKDGSLVDPKEESSTDDIESSIPTEKIDNEKIDNENDGPVPSVNEAVVTESSDSGEPTNESKAESAESTNPTDVMERENGLSVTAANEDVVTELVESPTFILSNKLFDSRRYTLDSPEALSRIMKAKMKTNIPRVHSMGVLDEHEITGELYQVRAKLAKSLKPRLGDDFSDINSSGQNMREIRVFLKTNAETLQRCLVSRKKNGYSYEFSRYTFDEVETYTIGSSTIFITYPERSEKCFHMEPLQNLPHGLDKIIFYEYSGIIDFGSFFKKSLILHESVLGPFLAKLKDHLRDVQVCLAEIETWNTEPQSNVAYLESTFNVKIEIPGQEMALVRDCKCPPGTHSDSLICQRCNRRLGDHTGDGNACPDFSPKSSGEGIPGEYPHSFQCKKYQLLKKFTNNDAPWKIEAKFNVASDRKKLEKLLKFMSADD